MNRYEPAPKVAKEIKPKSISWWAGILFTGFIHLATLLAHARQIFAKSIPYQHLQFGERRYQRQILYKVHDVEWTPLVFYEGHKKEDQKALQLYDRVQTAYMHAQPGEDSPQFGWSTGDTVQHNKELNCIVNVIATF